MQRKTKRADWAPGAAEVPEGYFSGHGVPPEKCGVWTPSWAPQPTAPELERNPDNIQLWKAAGFLSARERWLETETVLKCQLQNFICNHLPWIPAEGWQRGLETLEESQVCGSGAISLRQITPLQVASSWGDAVAPSTGITLPHPEEVKAGYWLQLQGISLISLTTKAENIKKLPEW